LDRGLAGRAAFDGAAFDRDVFFERDVFDFLLGKPLAL